MATLIPENIAGLCVLCKQPSRFDCKKCRAVSYCSDEHKFEDSAFHNPVCERWCNMQKEVAKGKVVDLKASTAREALRAHDGELHQLVFHRCCCNCRSTRDKLDACPECKAVFFCPAHPQAVHDCESMQLFVQCQQLLAASSYRPPLYKLSSRADEWRTLSKNAEETHRSLLERKMLGPSALAQAGSDLTLPLTILWALQTGAKVYLQRTSLTIHVLGPRLPEVVSLHYCEVLFHLLPHLRKLEIVLIGPDLSDDECDDEEYAMPKLCAECKSEDCKMSISFVPEYYHDFAQEEDFVAPHIAIALNAGFFLYPTWAETIGYLRTFTKTLSIITAHDEIDCRADEKIVKQAGCGIVVPSQPNPYSGSVPVRRPEDLTATYRRSSWMFAFTAKQRQMEEERAPLRTPTPQKKRGRK